MPSANRSGWKYVSLYTDNRGKRRAKFRRNGFTCHLPLPTAREFETAYARAISASERAPVSAPPTTALSLEWTARQVMQTPKWSALRKETKKAKARLYQRMIDAWGDTMMTDLDTGGILDRLDMVESPTVRNRIRGLFVELFDYLKDRRIVSANPAAEVARLKVDEVNTRPWTPAECAAFEARWPRGSRQRLAYELFRSTVQASVDICQMHRNLVDGDDIAGERSKTKAPFRARMTAGLRAELTHHTDRFMFLLTDYGKAFTPAGFNGWFNDACRAAGIDARSHGLRVLGCVELAEEGCTAKEIMAVSGHRTLAEAERYVRMASTKRLAQSASRKRELSSRNLLDNGGGEK